MLKKLSGQLKNALRTCHIKLKQRQYELFMYDDINLIPHTDWEKIVNNDAFWKISYHNALQKGCSKNLCFRYVLIYDNKEPVGLFYFQLINLRNLTIKDILNPVYFEKIYSRINQIGDNISFGDISKSSTYLLICGNLFVSGNYGISYNSKEFLIDLTKTFQKAMDMVEKDLKKDETIVATVIKDFDDSHLQLNELFQKSGFRQFEIDPDMVIPIDKNWKRFENYLDALSSKYRIRANNALARSESIIIKDFDASEIKKYSNEIGNLYQSVLNNAPVKIAANCADYFYYLKESQGSNFFFRAFIWQDRLVAFSTGLINSKCIYAHHIGLDYNANKTFALYQNILYSYINDAIKNNCNEINLGRDALEIKSTVGAVPVQLNLFIRFSNSFTHLLMESFTRLAQPRIWTQRRPFKTNGQVKV